MILYSNIFFVQKLIYSQESFPLKKQMKNSSRRKDKTHSKPAHYIPSKT